VHAPVCPYIQADPVEAIRRYFCPPLNSYLLEDTTIQVHPLNKPGVTVAGHAIRIWPQQHPGGSVGFRIDDALAYCTDTVVMMEKVEEATGVDLLLHELWLNDEDAAVQEKESQRHACLGPVAAFVRAARPRHFMPVHLYPHYTDAMLTRMTRAVQEASGVPSEIPVEGKSYDFPD